MEEAGIVAPELTIWVDRTGKRIGKPVKGDAVEDLVDRRIRIRPMLKFLPYPISGQRLVKFIEL